MKNRFLLFGALFVFLSGCAIHPLSPQKSQDVQNGNLAVGYLQLEKRIEYNELVYKVLWNKQRSQTAVFDGLWDIDSSLSTHLSWQLNKQGLNTQPVQENLNDNEMQEYKNLYMESDEKGIVGRKDDFVLELNPGIESQSNLLVRLPVLLLGPSVSLILPPGSL